MTTLQQLINQCEAHLGDSANATWLTGDIEYWVRDAIADYSLHYPRVIEQTINCAAVYEYDLTIGITEILTVEYPDGNTPPTFLEWKDKLDNDFYGSSGYYDVIMRGSASASTLITSENIGASGEDIIVRAQAVHDNTISLLSDLTVPDSHLHILKNYVLWQALIQIKSKEEVSPTSNSSLLMSQYAINADRARRVYIDSLAKALFTYSKSSRISWEDEAEESTRIY